MLWLKKLFHRLLQSLTLEKWTNCPNGDGTQTRKLSECKLEEKDGKTHESKHDHVGD